MLFVLIAVIASRVPVRRVMKVNPVIALRSEIAFWHTDVLGDTT